MGTFTQSAPWWSRKVGALGENMIQGAMGALGDPLARSGFMTIALAVVTARYTLYEDLDLPVYTKEGD